MRVSRSTTAAQRRTRAAHAGSVNTSSLAVSAVTRAQQQNEAISGAHTSASNKRATFVSVGTYPALFDVDADVFASLFAALADGAVFDVDRCPTSRVWPHSVNDWHQDGVVGQLDSWIFVWADMCPTELRTPAGDVETCRVHELAAFDNRVVSHRRPRLDEHELSTRRFLTVRLHAGELTADKLDALRTQLEALRPLGELPACSRRRLT